MPIRHLPRSTVTYRLIPYEADGTERPDADGTLSSRQLLQDVATGAFSDVFVMSHGWLGDVPAAIRQYDRWIRCMLDIAPALADVRPAIVALHWPSLPWGDERVDRVLGAEDFDGENDAKPDRLVELYAARLGDTPSTRAALRTILTTEPTDDAEPRAVIRPEVEQAYGVLFAESALGTENGRPAPAVPPGSDQKNFDPLAIAQEVQVASAAAATGPADRVLGGPRGRPSARQLLLAPLRQLSFWTMKDRARGIGETSIYRLLRDLRRAAPAGQLPRLHLMGHSFGCILVSAAVAGTGLGGPAGGVDTLFLVQGALSLWAFAEDIPFEGGGPGYFHQVIRDGLVRGPILTTRSPFDTAVGFWYPKGAGVARQKVLGGAFPRYGGVGTFGIQGVPGAVDMALPDGPGTDYAPGRLYNLDAKGVIRTGGWPSGAHSDIAHPALARAFLRAAGA